MKERSQREAVRVQIPAKPQKVYGTVRRLALVALLLVSQAFARHHTVHRNPPKRRVLMHTLFPTVGSLARQNEVASQMGLLRVPNRAVLGELVADGSLAPLPVSRALRSAVPQYRAFLHPAAAELLADLSSLFYEIWEKPLTVDSAVSERSHAVGAESHPHPRPRVWLYSPCIRL